MATLEFVLPEGSPDPCPNACGGLTEDPYGGPCKACWRQVGRGADPREEEFFCGNPDCSCGDEPDDDAGHGDDWPPVETVTAFSERGLL